MSSPLNIRDEALLLSAELQLYILENYPKGALIEAPKESGPFWRTPLPKPRDRVSPPPVEPTTQANPAPRPATALPSSQTKPVLSVAAATNHEMPKTHKPLSKHVVPALPVPQKNEAGAAPNKGSFALNIPPAPPADHFEDISALIQKLFPKMTLLPTPEETIPDRSNSAAVILLDLGEKDETRQMLEKIALAISERLQTPAAVLSIGAKQQSLPLEGPVRLLMAPLHRLMTHPLFSHAVSAAHTSTMIAHEGKPLWMMPDLTLIASHPDMKRKLWETITQLVARYRKI